MRKTIDLCRFGLLLSASMIASTVSSTAAQAQSSPAPVPLSRSPVDENGVNISTGKMQIPSAGLAIGPAGRGGLNYTGYILSVNSLWTYTANSYAIAESMAGGLILGSSGKTFSGGIATDGSGETYANGVYTMRDGTKIDITPLPLPPSKP